MALQSETHNRLWYALKEERYATELEAMLGGLGITGNVFYCDPASGSDNRSGKEPARAKASMNEAIALCTAGNGDIIVRRRGTETVTEPIVFNKSGVTVIAERQGFAPWFNGEYFAALADAAFTDGPVAQITASGVSIAGLGFVSRDTGATFFDGAAMLVGGIGDATPYGTHIYGCRFPKWAVDNRIGIAVEGSTNVTIERCDFEGVGANFAAGVYLQGATQNINILNNHFRQCTAAVKTGAFAGGGPHLFMGHNVVEDGTYVFDSQGNAGTGMIYRNVSPLASGSAFDRSVADMQTAGWEISGNIYPDS